MIAPGLSEALAGRYALERELGAGGMATVYLAQDLKHHRKVAVKVLRAEIAASLGADRFSREIEVAARLQHPHILPLLDSGEAGGFLYYVMPFVEGESLRERLARQGELPVHDAIKVLIEVVDALAHAHSHGVVHRDVKPDNIMLSGRHALVMDFGVAKAVSEATGRNQLTTAGVALGTPSYMAPEQAAADPNLDHRVDIYAVGAVAYEMLTGRPPFIGRTPHEVLAAQVTQTADPVERYRPGLSPAISEVVMRCLAKRPADRWQSAADLLRELEPLATPSGGMTPAQTRPVPAVARPRRLLVPLLAAAGLVALIVVFALSFHKTSALPIFGRQTQLTRDVGLEIEAAVSPDGKFLAYVVYDGGATRIMVRQVEGGEPVMIDPVRQDLQSAPQWSPDGNRLLFLSGRGIEVIPPLGGQSRLLIPATPRIRLLPGSFSPSGDEYAFTRGDTILIGNLEGATRVVLVTFDPHSVSWSPDGHLLAYVSGNGESRLPGMQYANTAPSAIAVIPAVGGTPVTVVEGGANLSPAWYGNTNLMYISDRDGTRDVYAVPVDGSGRPAGAATRLTAGLHAILLSVAANRSRAVYTVFRERSNIWSIPNHPNEVLSNSQATPVTTGNQIIERFSFSPDRRFVVYDSDRDGLSDLYILDVARGDIEPITPDSIVEFSPSWSPNGREIAYHAMVDGRRQIFVLDLRTRNTTQVTEGSDDQRVPRWSADGNRLYISTNVGGGGGISFMDRQPGGSWSAPQRMPPGTGPVAPDGRFTVLSGRIVNPAGDIVLQQLVPDQVARTRELVWMPDGSRLYYLGADQSDQVTGIWSVSPSGGAPRQHVRFDDVTRPWHRYGLRPFADRLYFTLGERESDIWSAELEANSPP